MLALSPYERRRWRRAELLRAALLLLGFLIASLLDQTLAREVPMSGKVVGAGAEAAYVRGGDLLRGKDWYQLLRLAGYLPAWIVVGATMGLAGTVGRRGGDSGGSGAWLGRGVLLVLGAGLAGLAAEILRVVFRRERPGAAGLYVWDWPWGPKPAAGWGLPSSHAAVAFGAAFVLARIAPGSGLVLFPLAAGCALSRMLAGAHFLSDVYLGAVVSYAVCRAILGTPGARAALGPR